MECPTLCLQTAVESWPWCCFNAAWSNCCTDKLPRLDLKGQVAWEKLLFAGRLTPPCIIYSVICECVFACVRSQNCNAFNITEILTDCCVLVVSPSFDVLHVFCVCKGGIDASCMLRSYSQCQCGGLRSERIQRFRCLAAWYWYKTEERWVDPWWSGWPLAYKETTSLTASRKYSQKRQSQCRHAAWKDQTSHINSSAV